MLVSLLDDLHSIGITLHLGWIHFCSCCVKVWRRIWLNLSRIIWLLMPPKPMALTPVRKGKEFGQICPSFNTCNLALSSVNWAWWRSHPVTSGKIWRWTAIVTLINPAIPAALVWPIFALIKPITALFTVSGWTWDKTSNSVASPTAFPVPWTSK